MAIILLVSEGCKTQQLSSKTSDQSAKQDTVSIPTDTIQYFLTAEGDTLFSLDEEVEIGLSPTLPDSLTFVAVGDLMMGTNFPEVHYLPPDSGHWLWKDVSTYLGDADITFGNLEGVILTDGGEQKKCNNPKACYLFRTPDDLAFHYKEHGFDLLSLANNHANDFGLTGRLNTQGVLDSLGIAYAGSSEKHYTSLTKKRVRIGMVAVAPNKGTLSIHQMDTVRSIVRHLDALNDIVIVSFHAGAEGAKNTHVTRKREFYYGEDRGNVYEFSHEMIDLGADILIGHGPHVPRAIELYKQRLIMYSLGNFLTYGRFNLRGLTGQAPLVKFTVDTEGAFLNGEIVSFLQDYDLGPRLDPQHRAAKSIQKLSREDFPENEIVVDDSGRILYLQKSIRE
ncbi:MAG: CapA family protein [Bacteroidota bacterium]